MISFWGWLFGILGAIVLGGVIGMVTIMILDFFMKKKYMSKKPDVSLMSKPEKKQLNEQEVKEDDQRRDAEFREYEKLRRIATGKPNVEGKSGVSSTASKLSEQGILPNDDGSSSRKSDGNSTKGIQCTKIADI